MTEEQYSAEKDLLRLIENPAEAEKHKAGGPSAASTKAGKKFSFNFFKKPSFASAPSYRRSRLAGIKKPANMAAWLSDRRHILRVLLVVTLCVLAYFVFTVVHEYSGLKKTQDLDRFLTGQAPKEELALEEGGSAAGVGDEGAAVTFEEGKDVSPRNLFKRGSRKQEEKKSDDSPAGLEDYRLVGISAEAKPADSYAMIENTKTNVTFFLKEGEKLDGIELVHILDGKLIVNVRGKEIELR